MSRRFPQWRSTLAVYALTIVLCLTAGVGVAYARDGDDGGGCHTFVYRDWQGNVLYYWTVCS